MHLSASKCIYLGSEVFKTGRLIFWSSVLYPGLEMERDTGRCHPLSSRALHFEESISSGLKCHNYYSQQYMEQIHKPTL
jgi:hypothetical protein